MKKEVEQELNCSRTVCPFKGDSVFNYQLAVKTDMVNHLHDKFFTYRIVNPEYAEACLAEAEELEAEIARAMRTGVWS